MEMEGGSEMTKVIDLEDSEAAALLRAASFAGFITELESEYEDEDEDEPLEVWVPEVVASKLDVADSPEVEDPDEGEALNVWYPRPC